MLGLVDSVVAVAEPAGESIGQGAGDWPCYYDTDEAAECEEAEIGGGEKVGWWGEEIGGDG